MPSLAFSKKVAFRYLWSKRSEAFITIITVISILGVAIGVTVLNIVMAVMTGFETELREKIVGTTSHIVVRRLGGKISDWHQATDIIAGVEGVESVSPFTYNQALVRVHGGSTGVLIRGIEENSAGARDLQQYIEGSGKVDSLFNPPPVTSFDLEGEETEVNLPGIIVGRELANNLNLLIGTPISILSPNVSSTPFGLMPKFKRFVVTGTYKSGLVEYESGLGYMSMKEAQRFFRMGDTVSGIEVRVKDIFESPKITKEIVDRLMKTGAGYIAQDWTETNKPLWDAIRQEKRVYFIVLLLIIVMASFSIIATLVMVVLEKRKDIAVLKTLGASRKAIGNIFRIQGAVIGAIGTVSGLILSYLGCVGLREYGYPLDARIFQMSELPVRIEPWNFAVVGISAFLICCVATIYPSRRASSLEPTDILRYE